MNVRYALLTVMLSLSVSMLVACEKKPEAAPAPGAAPAATAPAATTAAAAGAAPGQPAAGAAGTVVAAPGAGGTVVAANGNGKVLVNDAGVVTAKRANGDTVTTTPNGVTTANGVVVDSKKGTVVVPGVGTFATPPH